MTHCNLFFYIGHTHSMDQCRSMCAKQTVVLVGLTQATYLLLQDDAKKTCAMLGILQLRRMVKPCLIHTLGMCYSFILGVELNRATASDLRILMLLSSNCLRCGCTWKRSNFGSLCYLGGQLEGEETLCPWMTLEQRTPVSRV